MLRLPGPRRWSVVVGTYVFSGTGLAIYSVADRTLSVAKCSPQARQLRVSIDGVVRGEFVEYIPGQSTNAPIFVVHGLPDANHSLLVEPVDGWAAVSSIVVDHTPPAASAVHDSLLDGSTAIRPVFIKFRSLGHVVGSRCAEFKHHERLANDLYRYQKQNNQKFQIIKVGKGTYTLTQFHALV